MSLSMLIWSLRGLSAHSSEIIKFELTGSVIPPERYQFRYAF